MAAAAIATNSGLTKVSFGANAFGDDGAASLAAMLAKNTVLEELELWLNTMVIHCPFNCL